ncbi:MAG: hypothetical protein DRP55_02975, partial [Spirochaetes bacterium]
VEKVTPKIAKEIGLRRVTGVIIKNVEPNSPAAKVGLEVGDIIFRVGNREVDNEREFSSLVSKYAKQDGVVLLVRDHKTGQVGYVMVPIE